MQTRIHLELLPIEDDGFHILMGGMINGKPARLLIDTGASRTVFDLERIRLFLPEDHPLEKIDKLSTGLGTNTMESQVVVLEKFRLGRITLENYKAVALNMEHINQSYRMLGYPLIDGVLGGDLLLQLSAVIDYKNMQIRLRSLEEKDQ